MSGENTRGKQRKNTRTREKSARAKRRAAWRLAHRNQCRRAKTVSYHILSAAIVLCALLYGFLRSPQSCLRFWEGLRDLFHTICGFAVTPTVAQLPYGIIEGFPKALEEFGQIAKNFGMAFISKDNFLGYLSLLGKILEWTAYILAYGLLPVALLIGIAVFSISKQNTRHGELSKPMQAFLSLREHVLLPAGKYLKGLFRFFVHRKKYFLTLILAALFFLNVYTIVLEFFAAYFYYVIFATDFSGLGVQLVKLAYDLFLAFRLFPVWVWILIGLKLFDKIRKSRGYAILDKYEQSIRDFLGERGVNILICGPPRTGKTTLLVSVAKSLMAVARKNAHEGMRDIERKFPDFPWIVLEMMLLKAYRRRRVRNLYHARMWVNSFARMSKAEEKEAFLRYLNRAYRSCSETPFKYPFFNYDTARFKTVYNGGLGIETVEEAASVYAQLYLIYIQPSLIIANFSIRSDDNFLDGGNFPEWRDDFFRGEPDPVAHSIFAHIFNQDMVRPGKQVDPACPYVNSFEYGFLIETEVGKERGNQYDKEGKRRNDENANVLNDLRDSEFKLMGHKGTIYHIPFAGYVGDEQRPESWSANARELCDVISIRERCPDKIILPFFAFEQAFYLIVKGLFGKYYDSVRFNRGDTTLLTYTLKHFSKKVIDHYDYINNKFGGHFLKLNVEMGMKQEGDKKAKNQKAKLFISNAKVYANVFKTDAWKGVMEHRTAKSSMGLDDVPYFKDVDASLEEFLEMRSYFFSELLRVYDGDAQEKESALALIMGTLNTFYLQAMKAFGEKPAKELLGEFAAALPRIVCGDKPEELQNKLIKQRNELWKKGEAEKAAQEKEAAKKENKDKTDKAAKADAAQKT